MSDSSETYPDWMCVEQTKSSALVESRSAELELEKQSFSIAYEDAIEHIASGKSLASFCHEYHMPISPIRYRAWLFRDPIRKEQYRLAQKIGAEAIEDDLTRIADGLDESGNPTLADVPRSQLMVNTRKFILQVRNRERYGDVKRVDTTVTTVDSENVRKMTTVELKEMLVRRVSPDSTDDAIDVDANELFDIELDDPFETSETSDEQ